MNRRQRKKARQSPTLLARVLGLPVAQVQALFCTEDRGHRLRTFAGWPTLVNSDGLTQQIAALRRVALHGLPVEDHRA